jgi:DNA-binding YbaB/EbfC family protein
MANINKMMKQAQQMQAKLTTLQKELDSKEFEASSGGGVVKAKVNGKQEILELKIDPTCVDTSDIEMLEELVKTALNQALTESQETVSKAMSKVTGGMSIPGLF